MYVNVDIDIDEVISEATDEQIKDEAEGRGFYVFDEDPTEKEDMNLRRLLCDELDVNYHTPTNELLELIAKKI